MAPKITDRASMLKKAVFILSLQFNKEGMGQKIIKFEANLPHRESLLSNGFLLYSCNIGRNCC
jgi:hypothetical protein